MNVDDLGHFTPIESHEVQLGVPDFAYTLDGFNGWLELKAGSHDRAPVLRIMQRVWLKRNCSNGGHPLILCAMMLKDGSHIFGLIHGSSYDSIYRKSARDWRLAMASTATWTGRIVWPEFISHLKNPDLLVQ
jgi:hypothetical protein